MNKWIIFSLFLTISCEALAQSPTIIFAADKNNALLLEQPDNNENPLGNPIVVPAAAPVEHQISSVPIAPVQQNSQQTPAMEPLNEISEFESVNPEISPQTSPQIEAGKIQNTIYQGGQRIYDIQSIPIKDINEVEEPNIQPTITTYPAY